MRSLINLAGPVDDGEKRYENVKDNRLDQEKFVTEFQTKLRDFADEETDKGKIQVRAFGRLLFDVVFAETLQEDVFFAIFSGMFVFCYIWFHLESLFMTSLAMLMILLSFPVSYLFYSGIFRVTMNTTLNQLVIFIVLGIAADDIFVFCDAWRQSAYVPRIKDDDRKRMAYAFKRSFRAITVTSSTTAVAFAANAFSDVRPIRAFGIFAAIIIPVNFFILIMMMPPIQYLHDKHLKERCAYKKICCFCCNKEKNAAAVNDIEKQDKTKEGAIEKPAPDRITRCFSGPFDRFVIKARYILVVLFLILGVVAVIIASDIGPLTK